MEQNPESVFKNIPELLHGLLRDAELDWSGDELLFSPTTMMAKGEIKHPSPHVPPKPT
jgi:hypothetical protein